MVSQGSAPRGYGSTGTPSDRLSRSSGGRTSRSRGSGQRISSRRSREPDERTSLLNDYYHSVAKRLNTSTICQLLLIVVVFSLLGDIAWIQFIRYNRSLDPARQEQILKDWEREVEEHLNYSAQLREEREGIYVDYKSMSDSRKQWRLQDQEWEEKQAEWNKEQREWEMRKEHEAALDRAWDEKQRKEEDKRNAFHWEYPRADGRCQQYGLREYMTSLVFAEGVGMDPLLGCVSTPLELHGEEYQVPEYCEVKALPGWFGAPVEYIGHWTVGDESGCNTYWDTVQDQGCTSPHSGIHRYEANLLNLRSSDDWQEMCATTPADYNGQHFNAPDACAHWGKHGIWGIWFLQDGGCD